MTTKLSSSIPSSGKNAGNGQSAQAGGAEWPHLPAALGFLTGMIDIAGWLTLGGFFSANITGDLVESVSYFVPGRPLHPLQVLAIPAFFVGAVSVYFLARRLGSANVAMVRSVLFTQFLLLVLVCGLSETAKHTLAPDGLPFVVIGTAIVLAIAVSNTSMHLLDNQAATTWALTANTVIATIALLNIVTKYGSEEDRAKDWKKWRSIWPVIVCFLLGGLGGTLAVSFLHRWAWSIPAAVSLLLLITLRPQPRAAKAIT